MDSQRPALSPGGPQGLASPLGVWRLEATPRSGAGALPAPVGPSWRVWGHDALPIWFSPVKSPDENPAQLTAWLYPLDPEEKIQPNCA